MPPIIGYLVIIPLGYVVLIAGGWWLSEWLMDRQIHRK